MKIGVEINKPGEHSEQILKIVATNNAGLKEVTMKQLQHYLKVRDALFEGCTNDLGYISDKGSMSISNDKGKTSSCIYSH